MDKVCTRIARWEWGTCISHFRTTWGYTGAQPWAICTGIKGQGPRTRGAAQGRGGHQPHVTNEETELQTSGGSEEGFFSFTSPSR